ncbi:MAG: peptide chain release factor N(5)-glutamine methyltransferase [Succinivibrio sp.]|nr:peptide chain release factor N(5)-glutamine methyltransferase [Succinivibrio sp.]
MTAVRGLLTEGAAVLRRAGITSAQTDAQLLLASLLKVERVRLFIDDQQEVPPEVESRYQAQLRERALGCPVAYLTGSKEFYGLTLAVGPGVLVPRPETELLVETALSFADAHSVLDLGTGSGAVALALKHEAPHLEVWACDISEKALTMARDNAATLGLEVNFLHSNWFEALPSRHWDLIVSNPPYIAAGDPHLTQGALPFEPPEALSSGAAGLDAITHIVANASAYLSPGGSLLFEHGYEQGAACRDLLCSYGYLEIHTLKDLQGLERVSLGRHPQHEQ